MRTTVQPADWSRPSFNDPSWNISEQMHGWIKIRFKWIWRNLKKRFNYNFEHSYQDKTPCYLFVHFSVVNYRGPSIRGVII